VGSPDNPLIRIGNAKAGSATKQSGTFSSAVFFVDVAEQGKVYRYGGTDRVAARSSSSSSDGVFGGGNSNLNNSRSNNCLTWSSVDYATEDPTSKQKIVNAAHDVSQDRCQHDRASSSSRDDSLQDANSLSSESSGSVPWNDDVQSVFNEWLTDEGGDDVREECGRLSAGPAELE